MATQEVVINNSTGLSARFFSLLCSKEMTDVSLQVGTYRFELHKLILSASSNVFKAMLMNASWPECNNKPVVLNEEPLCEAVFARFIEYIYSGELYLSHCTVCPLLTLADKYDVREMIPLCRTYMLKNLDAPINQSCVLQWWKIAHLRGDHEMEDAIRTFIECNFSQILQTPDFLTADFQTVNSLLNSSGLLVRSEREILYGLMAWLEVFVENGEHKEKDIQFVFSSLLGHIRWAMLMPCELDCLKDFQDFLSVYHQFIRPDYLTSFQKNFSSTCMTLSIDTHTRLEAVQASSYSINCVSEVCNPNTCKTIMKTKESTHLDKNKSFYLPRVYINDFWCSTLTISDFLNFPQYGAQTFLFSTPALQHCGCKSRSLDWEIEIFPKGVRFLPAVLIGLEQDGNKLIEESNIETMRISVMSCSEMELPLKVEVNAFVRVQSRCQPNSSYVERCFKQVCIFDSPRDRHNLDNVVSLENISNFLHVEDTSLHLMSAMAFTLFIVIRPLPFAEVT